jgi:hypothetical protein
MVQLVDRPPLAISTESSATLWLAIAPPPAADCFILTSGTTGLPSSRSDPPEARVAYFVDEAESPGAGTLHAAGLPPEIVAEIERIEKLHRRVLGTQPMSEWRLDDVRASYQALLKRAGDNPAVEAAVRPLMVRVTRHEQAARGARTIEGILKESRRRDAEVAGVRQELARTEGSRTRTYSAIGLIQRSSRMVEGRRLYALVGSDGSTLAYLDMPPGIDPERLQSRRVGVHGAAHFDQDLGARLIVVRDIETVGSRR